MNFIAKDSPLLIFELKISLNLLPVREKILCVESYKTNYKSSNFCIHSGDCRYYERKTFWI